MLNRLPFDGAALVGISWHTGFVATTKARKTVAFMGEERNGQNIHSVGVTDMLGPRLSLSCRSALLNTRLPPQDLSLLPQVPSFRLYSIE